MSETNPTPQLETPAPNEIAAQEADAFYSERAALLADFANISDEQMAQEMGEELISTDATEDTGQAEAETPSEPSGEDGETSNDAETDETDAPDEPSEPDSETEDDDLAKNLDKIQREKKRSETEIAAQKRELASEKQQFEQQQAEWRERVQRAEQFEAAQQRVNIDPIAALQALGFKGDYKGLGRQAWAVHQANEGNPEQAELAARLVKEREADSRVAHLEKTVETLVNELRTERSERQVQDYLGKIATAASDETPLVKNWLSNDKAAATNALRQKAHELWKATGEEPDAGDVIKALERDRTDELTKLGIDPSLIKGSKPTPKNETPKAGEKRNGKPLSNDLGNPTPPRSEPQSRDELLANLAKEMPWRE